MKYTFLIFICLFFIACSKPTAPTFSKMENVEVLDVKNGQVYVTANADFTVPVNINFPLKKVFESKKGLLKGVLNALIDKKANVKYEGTITLNFLKVDFDVPVDYEGELVIK